MLPFSVSAGSKKDKWGEILPLRKLGKTAVNVTMLGLGGYHVGWTTERNAQEVIETAMEGGVRFLPQYRGRVIGIAVSVGYLGLAFGPFVGGLLTEFIGWRSFFCGFGAWATHLCCCILIFRERRSI